MNRYCLDSSALLVWYGAERGHAKMRTLLAEVRKKKAILLMSWVNLAEVAVQLRRKMPAEQALRQISLQIEAGLLPVDASREIAIEGAHLISERGLPLADAFAAATALASSATLVTTDPHLRAVEGEVPILWLR